MDQTIDQIEADIDRTRVRLGSNLRELKDRVDVATDWQEYVRARPWTILGAAAVVGMIVATAMPRRGIDWRNLHD